MLMKYMKLSTSNFKYLILGLISAIISSYNGVYVNHYTSLIIQGDFSNESLYNLYYYSILTIIFTSIRGALFTYSQKYMNNHLKLLVYEKILNQPPSFYEITPVSELNDYIHHDTRLVADIISLNINVLTRSILNIIITFYLIYEISYKLCILMILLITLNIIISFFYDKLYKYYMNGHEEIIKKLNNFIYESFSHISIQKTLAIEDISKNKLMIFNDQISKYFIKETYLYAINAFIHFNMPTSTMIIIILSAKHLNLTTNLITFILHFKSVFQTIKEIIEVHNEISKTDKSYKKINNLLDTPPIKKGSYIPTKFFTPSIIFQNISFKYQKSLTPILNNFNFSINPYDKIAIIGSSGEGKSTIAKLLVGLLKINEGSIFINNINIGFYDNVWLKSKIGYVAQETILFSDTIANNISYGLIKSNEEIEEASKLANADEFISKLPNKYKTNLEGTELSSLSGGQKQRISIARALIRKPEIIIFDEATSALDPYCEEIVQKTIKECFDKNNATMIVIAHRKSALEIVDKIYKLEKSQLLPFNNI